MCVLYFFFFFQAEDGIRDYKVTGVQTCALPIFFCSALLGAGLGFLWFNCHPAQMFMGDTGSLPIGGALGVVAVLIHQPFVLVIAGGGFVVEAVSVVLQTGWFRYTRCRSATWSRIFFIAPIRRHFEM